MLLSLHLIKKQQKQNILLMYHKHYYSNNIDQSACTNWDQ